MRQPSVKRQDQIKGVIFKTLVLASAATVIFFGIKHGTKFWGNENAPVKDPTEQTETVKPEDTSNPIINHYHYYYNNTYTCDEDCPCRTEDGGKKEDDKKEEDDKKKEEDDKKEEETKPTEKPGIDIEQVTTPTTTPTTPTTPPESSEETTTTTPTTPTGPTEETTPETTTPSEEQKLPGIGINGPEIPMEPGR
ncbi:MAG: hypothetical protein IKI95_00195 [Clostridia bacterium]|nr:hypothetical protein [Clostridia bacterium]